MRAFNRIALYTAKASCILVCLTVALGRYIAAQKTVEPAFDYALITLALILMPGIIAYAAISVFPAHIEQWIVRASAPIEEWVDASPMRARCMAIVVIAGLSLFLELMLIRWQSGLFAVFTLHKNFTLLACFCGLGLGYAIARQTPLLLPLSLPLLALNLLLLMLLRYGTDSNILYMLQAVPVEDKVTMAVFHTDQWNFMSNPLFYLPVCLLLAMTFMLNALTLLPVGQFCGYLMQRGGAPLATYGYNLLGSILGVILLFLLSWLWVGPVIWFGVCVAFLLWYQLSSPQARYIGLTSAVACVIIAAWPARPMVENIYSPYQLIEKVADENGLMRFIAAGSYIQKIEDFTDVNDVWHNRVLGFFALPYKAAPSTDRVLITGSGCGNDVEGAILNNAGSIDAVEIDPAIVTLGRANHPQHPYQDKRVHATINDARSFFKNNSNLYDVIVFGGQDTTILLSHGSNVRLDTFVYTVQGLNEAYSHLKPGGIMSMSFVLGKDLYLGKKIYHMLKGLPGASTPLSVSNGFITAFMVGKNAAPNLPAGFLTKYELTDVTGQYEQPDETTLDSIPTDNWPFFYMKAKTYPVNYAISVALALGLSLLLVRKILPAQRWDTSLVPFFLLGVGFMLVETKAITELGLVFGNTWQVIGITIIGVLVMAYCANVSVSRYPAVPLILAFSCLLAIIALGYAIAIHGGISYTGIGAKLGALVLLTSPLFFSGIVFSTCLKNTRDITGAMAYNLMGAMLGGLLEYNSLRFGFASLYLIAFVFYGLAWLSARRLQPT